VERKKTKRTAKKAKAMKKLQKRKKAIRKTKKRAVVSTEKSIEQPRAPYVAPRRIEIKDAVCAVLPHIDPRLIKTLDYWVLYTIHQDVVKDGKDAEALARRLIRGYDPDKNMGLNPKHTAGAAKEKEQMKREHERAARVSSARERALAARERARAAKERAGAAAHAAKERARAAIRAARDRARDGRMARPRPEAAQAAPGAPAHARERTVTAAPARRTMGSAYIAPVRTKIKDELARVMPMIKRSDLTGIDYWALYTMHSEIVKSGRNPEELARKFVKGYTKAKK
jgi:hypothetical protein